VARWGLLLYPAAAVAVAVPLATSSSNSLQASSIGEGGPSFLGVGAASAETLLSARDAHRRRRQHAQEFGGHHRLLCFGYGSHGAVGRRLPRRIG
jgi:hypothetical protein